MVSNKQLPRSLAHADHMVAQFVQTQQELIAITCKRAVAARFFSPRLPHVADDYDSPHRNPWEHQVPTNRVNDLDLVISTRSKRQDDNGVTAL